MGIFNRDCSCSCTLAAVIVSLIIGIVAAFLQITAVITVSTAFLWVIFGVAVVYLAVLIGASASFPRAENNECFRVSLQALLFGIRGTILFSLILLAAGIVATSVISAILVGLLLFFFSLTVAASACYVKCTAICEA